MRAIHYIPLFILLLHAGLLRAINPEYDYPYSPESFDIKNYATNYIKTPDGHTLISWDFPPAKSQETDNVIIVSYGDSGNMSYCLYYVKLLIDAGHRVITFDYRGFGKSSTFKTNNDFLYYREFATDLSTVIVSTRQKYVNKHVGIMAFSMGTIITTFASKTTPIDFLIAENYVLDPNVVVERLKKESQRNFLIPADTENMKDLISNITCPMLLFAGTLDKITTTSDSKAIADMRGNRKLITFQGKHAEGLIALTKTKHGDLYIHHINDFLSAR